jgi:xanthine dehydrogenase accessory factor
MNNIYLLLPDIVKPSAYFAVATVIETSGSTPQKSGCSALFGSSGLIAGTIGGGILEGKVQQIAMELLKKKESGIYHFNLDYDISFKQNAICGGQATILIDASPGEHSSVFNQVKESHANRMAGVLITTVSGNDDLNKKIRRYWVTSDENDVLPERYSDFVREEVKRLFLSENKNGFKKTEMAFNGETKSELVLLEHLSPPPQLIIAGAGHIGKALAHLGKLLEFEVTVIDNRPEFANEFNIPDADHIIVEDIGIAMQNLKQDAGSYIVIVTRGHDDDAKALLPCINSCAAYVGMIGSRNKIAKMHNSFIQNEWANEKQWGAIHAPIGLEIGSQTVEEIAVSIAAQLVLIKSSKASGDWHQAKGNR